MHEFWGVFEKGSGKLIAYAINTVNKFFVNYNALKAIPELMNKHYPYYGLLYEMNHYYLEEYGCRYVTDGWRSVSDHSGIQPFLERNFRFRKAYVKMRLYYTVWFGLIVRFLYPFRQFKYLPLNVKNILKFESYNRESMKNYD